MKKKYTIILLVIAITLATTITIGTSYSFWSLTRTQSSSNLIEAGCFSFTVDDLDANDYNTNINLTNAYPVNDTKGLLTKPYKLTITNTCSIKASYSILLSTLSTSTLNTNKIKYHIIKVDPTTTTMTPALISTLTPGVYTPDFKNNLSNQANANINDVYKIGEGILNAVDNNTYDSVTYNLRMWLDETADNDDMNSSFAAAIAVYAEATS